MFMERSYQWIVGVVGGLWYENPAAILGLLEVSRRLKQFCIPLRLLPDIDRPRNMFRMFGFEYAEGHCYQSVRAAKEWPRQTRRRAMQRYSATI